MNKKWIVSTVVVFVVWMIGSFLVHGLWLQATYDTMVGMVRPVADQESRMHLMLIAHLLMSGAFVWIFQRGNESKPWLQQGLRFGVAIALFAVVPTYLIYEAVFQNPEGLALKQIIGDSVLVVVVGLVTAFLNKDTA